MSKLQKALRKANEELSRREFLKALGIGTGTLALTPFSTSLFKITSPPQTSNIDADQVDGLELVTDTLSNRPSAGTPGRLFYATDGQGVYYDNGSSWNQVSAGVTLSLDTDTTLNSQTIKIVVYEDTDGDGTAENAQYINLGNGTNNYQLDQLNGSTGNTIWLRTILDTTSLTSTPILKQASTNNPNETFTGATALNNARDATAVNHENISNTDHTNATTVKKGPRYGDVHPLNDPSNSLVGWWPLHTSGSTAPDLSGNGNDGSVTGTTQVAGLRGLPARDFDGSDDYVDTTLTSVGTPLSFCAWYKYSSDGDIVAKRQNSGDYAGWELKSFSGDLEWNVVETSGTNANVRPPFALDDGKWHHLVGTWDGSTAVVYADGSQIASTSNNISVSNTSPTRIGARDGPNKYVGGYIADVRVYDRALSSSEVRTLAEWGGISV